MRERRVRVIKPFTNKFGQVIEPGNPVFVVTVCTGHTKITWGEYIGFIEREGEQYAQVKVECTTSRAVYKDTDEVVVWKNFDANRGVKWTFAPAHRITTLQLNRILRDHSTITNLTEIL